MVSKNMEEIIFFKSSFFLFFWTQIGSPIIPCCGTYNSLCKKLKFKSEMKAVAKWVQGGRSQPLLHTRECSWLQCFWRSLGGFHQNLKCVYPLMQQFHLYARETHTSKKDRGTRMFVVAPVMVVKHC